MQLNAMQLIEILKQVDPLTPIVREVFDIETGYILKPIEGFKDEIVRMTTARAIDAFNGTPFTTNQLRSCTIDKPNAFKVLVLK